MPELAVTVAVLHEGRVLLTRREDFEIWCLPGGAAEPRELPQAAAVREVREETGLEVRLTRLAAVVVRPNVVDDGRISLLFAAELAGGALAPDPAEVVEAGFFAPDALPAPIMAPHGQLLGELLSGAAPQLWFNMDAPPPGLAGRAALYRWRDELGVPRAEAYAELLRLMGPGELLRAIG